MFPSDNSLDFKVSMESESFPVQDDESFHILVLGDWSGRENRANFEQVNRESQLIQIDRDDFESVLKSLRVSLDLSLTGDGQNIISLRFAELDDFHPDKIFKQASVFSDLRSLRERLSNSDTFEKAADEVRALIVTEPVEDSAQNQTTNEQSEKSHSSSTQLLEDILSKSGQEVPFNYSQASDNRGLNLLIGKLVKPFLIETDENEQMKLVSALDEAVSGLMRKIIQHPEFKKLESAWRGLYFLVRGVETDSKLKIFIFDISKSEFSSNLKSSIDSKKIGIFDILENDMDWAVICGNYSFKINVDDIASLIRMAKISNAINAPFVSYLDMEVVDNETFTENQEPKISKLAGDHSKAKLWDTIRAIPESESVGLLFQRLLARLPYGAETDPTERFSFEEISNEVKYKDFLWVNPCFAFALLLVQNYGLYGWKIDKALNLDIEGVPILVYDNDGKNKIVPMSEFVITESFCEDLLQLGLMPVINYHNSDKMCLARIQSIAFPMKQLKGKWN